MRTGCHNSFQERSFIDPAGTCRLFLSALMYSSKSMCLIYFLPLLPIPPFLPTIQCLSTCTQENDQCFSSSLSYIATCNADRNIVYYFRLNNMHALRVAFDELFAVKLAHRDCRIRQKCGKGKGKEPFFKRRFGLQPQKGLEFLCVSVFLPHYGNRVRL